MSLFSDLPAPTRPDNEASHRNDKTDANRRNDKGDGARSSLSLNSGTVRSAAPVPAKSSLKRTAPEEEGRAEDEPPKRERKQVRFHTFEEVADEKVESAIAKIAAHIGNPSKVPKAAKLASQLLTSGSITAANARSFFRILAAAMADPYLAISPGLASAYKELFSDCAEHLMDLLSKDQKAQLQVWLLWADLNNSLSTTDDSFEFARVTGRIQKEIELLPEATEEEDQAEEATAAHSPGQSEASRQVDGLSAEALGPAALSRWGRVAQEPSEGKLKQKTNIRSEGRVESPSEGRSERPREGGSAGQGASAGSCQEPVEEDMDPFGLGELMGQGKGSFSEGSQEEDPFGLGDLLPTQSKLARRVLRAKQRQEEEAVGRRVKAEGARLMRERREALVVCLQSAADKYKHKWAQTAIDILASHAHENKGRFTAKQRKAVEELWLSVKDQQHRRKHGRGATGKLDVTPFERLADMYAKDKISIRKGVGDSGGRGTISWLG